MPSTEVRNWRLEQTQRRGTAREGWTEMGNLIFGSGQEGEVECTFSSYSTPHIFFKKHQNKQTMKSQIDRSSLPPQKEYKVTIHHLPMKVQCETYVREASPTSDQSDDMPVIENYYCYNAGADLVKVTKIRIGAETVTMMDRISFHENQFIEELTKDNSSNSSAPEVPSDKTWPIRKEYISSVVRRLLNNFEAWLRENEPELLSIFKQAKEKGASEEELRDSFNFNSQLRESFLRFSEGLGGKMKGRMLQLMRSWESSFGPAHKRYLHEEQYLNTILSEVTKNK